MKRLSKELKQMLNALAHQDAGEFLTMRDKLNILDVKGTVGSEGASHEASSARIRRIAMLSDGGDSSKALHYALNACKRQQASLDLVLHGAAARQAGEIRSLLHGHDIASEVVLLGEQSVKALSEYLHSRRNLSSLVASTGDPLALELTEEVLPRRGGRMHLPLVLIDNARTPHRHTNRINAA